MNLLSIYIRYAHLGSILIEPPATMHSGSMAHPKKGSP